MWPSSGIQWRPLIFNQGYLKLLVISNLTRLPVDLRQCITVIFSLHGYISKTLLCQKKNICFTNSKTCCAGTAKAELGATENIHTMRPKTEREARILKTATVSPSPDRIELSRRKKKNLKTHPWRGFDWYT